MKKSLKIAAAMLTLAIGSLNVGVASANWVPPSNPLPHFNPMDAIGQGIYIPTPQPEGPTIQAPSGYAPCQFCNAPFPLDVPGSAPITDAPTYPEMQYPAESVSEPDIQVQYPD